MDDAQKREMKRRTPTHFGKRFSVSAFIPSKQLADIAHERTEGMVGYFLSCAHKRDPIKWQDDLYTLARSCYLQGAFDMVEAAVTLQKRPKR